MDNLSIGFLQRLNEQCLFPETAKELVEDLVGKLVDGQQKPSEARQVTIYLNDGW